MSDASLSSEQSGAPEQSGTQSFPIIVSSTTAEPPAATRLVIHDPADAIHDLSEAFTLAGELNQPQRQVLQQLSLGVSLTQAAKTTGVGLRSISRWVNHDPKFIAALNAWKNEQLESARSSAFAMADLVMAALRSGIEKGNTAIAFRMAREMGLLSSHAGPIDAGEVERRQRIRGARVEDELSQAEYRFDLNLHDRAEKEGIVWANCAPRRLTHREQSLLKFLRDKVAGRTHGAVILFNKRQMLDMLREAGVPEEQAMLFLATYPRPYPGFYEPDDLPYGEEEEGGAVLSEQPAEAQAEQAASQDPTAG